MGIQQYSQNTILFNISNNSIQCSFGTYLYGIENINDLLPEDKDFVLGQSALNNFVIPCKM